MAGKCGGFLELARQIAKFMSPPCFPAIQYFKFLYSVVKLLLVMNYCQLYLVDKDDC